AVIAKAHGEMRDKLPLKDQPARQAWRDKRLMALAKHFQEVGE
ncbi:MAG: 3-hydroxyacyl-CoA dehydrogenase, partial [Rhodospirillaceae bacterium]|nr:3-hydroxyacyl-CoA dehydrogenase [Rhodospirillaceae bacterium]